MSVKVPGYGRLAFAFLLVWIPYIASTGLQERFEQTGALGPALMLLSLLLCWPAARLIGGSDPFALKLNKPVLAGFAVALVVGMLLQSVRLVIGEASGALSIISAEAPVSILPFLTAAVVMTFVPSLAEDIITRGFPLFAARPRLSSILLIAALSAIIYTANHLWRVDWGWTEQARLLAIGLACALVALRSGSLWAAVGLHWGWNLAIALAPAAVAVSSADPNLDRLTGAALHLLIALLAWAWPVRASDSGSRGSRS